MDSARIAALLRPYVTPSQEKLTFTSMYIDILMRWNARMNLTAVRNPEEIVTRHFGESFFAAEQLLGGGGELDVIDVGSGAGFPGLPMAIVAPSAEFTLVESNSKKAAFLSEVIAALKLSNVKVFHGRAEFCDADADLVTMRAVEQFDKSLPLAAHLVRHSGRIGLMLGASQVESARDLAPEMEWDQPVCIPQSEARVLLAGTKIVKVG